MERADTEEFDGGDEGSARFLEQVGVGALGGGERHAQAQAGGAADEGVFLVEQDVVIADRGRPGDEPGPGEGQAISAGNGFGRLASVV